jgi:hypothetical protein
MQRNFACFHVVFKLTTPIDDAVTPFPIPDNTPPVTTTILRSESSASSTRASRAGGRLLPRRGQLLLPRGGGAKKEHTGPGEMNARQQKDHRLIAEKRGVT